MIMQKLLICHRQAGLRMFATNTAEQSVVAIDIWYPPTSAVGKTRTCDEPFY